jgi:hypothetical protein
MKITKAVLIIGGLLAATPASAAEAEITPSPGLVREFGYEGAQIYAQGMDKIMEDFDRELYRCAEN